MTSFFKMFIDYISDFWFVLEQNRFEFFGFSVSIPTIIVGFIVIGLTISYFWKGAKT